MTKEQINLETAKTIGTQLGGINKLAAMIGAKNFMAIDEGLQFHFGLCRKSNICRITLNSLDLYDIEFWQYSKTHYTSTKKQVYNNIYNDQLKSIFESFTGLYLSL